MLITFEGPDGCGKSTQIRNIGTWLARVQSRPVVITHEPGGSAIGKSIRSMLVDPLLDVAPLTELLLFTADRAEHVSKIIKPALANGSIVLCDRFTASTVAYQGYGRGIDLGLINQLNTIACDGLKPDLTLWLDVPVMQSLKRIQRRKNADRIDRESIAFFEAVWSGYAAMWRDGRVKRVDGVGSEREVCDRLKGFISRKLGTAL